MQALIHVLPSQAHPLARTGSRRALALCGGLVAMALVLPAFQGSFLAGSGALAQEKPRDQACARWDELAREAIVHLVRGNDDSVLRQVTDAVWRMRRARHTCQLGWAQLACHQYRALVQGVPSFAWPDRDLGCTAVSARTAHATEAGGRVLDPTAASAAFATAAPAQMTCGQLFATYPPVDEALGNLGGDPFAYHVFNREAELSELRQSSDACLNRTAAIAGQ